MPRRPRSIGLQITRPGLWYVVAIVVVALAATNTGNNGLFLVVASLGAALVVAHVVATWNVRGFDLEVTARDELFANEVAKIDLTVRSRGILPRWLLIFTIDPSDVETVGKETRRADRPRRRGTRPWLLSLLRPRDERSGTIEVLFRRRGPRRVRSVRVISLFPLGLFRKGRSHPRDLEILVYPELFDSASERDHRAGSSGETPSRRPGFGHDLYALRRYRPGDDPRGIHWKQTARQRRLIVQQRETDENRRLAIVLDNAVGSLEPAQEKRFERLVSEAATAAVHHLQQGFQVALTTRDVELPFAAGRRQRRLVLETLARLEARPRERFPLGQRQGAAHLRLALDLPVDGPGDRDPAGSGGWRHVG